jgi:hypothetical protein
LKPAALLLRGADFGEDESGLCGDFWGLHNLGFLSAKIALGDLVLGRHFQNLPRLAPCGARLNDFDQALHARLPILRPAGEDAQVRQNLAFARAVRVEHLAVPLVNAGAPVTQDHPLLAYKKIVSNAGPLRLDGDPARPLRDEVAVLLINNLVTQKRHHIKSVAELADLGVSNGGFGTLNSTAAPADADHDGMPDFWENALGAKAASDDHNALLASGGGMISGTTFFPPNTPAGYTLLEEYLHFLAIPHGTIAKSGSGAPSAITIDLCKFTSGFTKSPAFTLSNKVGGAFEQLAADGVTASPEGPIVKFTAPHAAGRAMFDFTVLDADGSQWKQTFAILVFDSP